ncbi:MAG: hypoxanthine phosphoribosyltransferase [Clostridiales bacterium]|jgi:hypoxanthine phosphoribosyltransferase|nr:hypoxanthine phosphoribosyltransferase [Clostridiales bacterium]MBQ4190602.1 hypoxanthine phosphoribosyltransferase [Clostridiales bacterium]MBQ4217374.1 hypoxanthine phosphoribosyltransferase [Clostridiales bacterium]MBQ5423353.1 hypoxanthine phosphoribosyltransferase [Clostridiales bacterium]MBQ7627752.1 hypoxanthine phosphoribosyltransferase [Clostridiales bacterium]
MIDTSEVLITHEQIQEMLDRLAAELNRDYAGRPLVVVGILTGAFIFCSDLVRRLEMPVIVDFMQVSSYVGEISTGNLKIKKDMSYDIAGKDVLIVEDIIDTGRTLALLKEQLLKRGPASLKICTAFDKPDRRVTELVPDYNGITIPDKFIVGYGLDLDGEYRNYDDIRVVKQE